MAASPKTAVRTSGPAGRIELRQVQEEQRDQVSRFKERSAETHAQTERFANVREKFQEALATGNLDTLRILNADFASASQQNAQNTKDLSQMMAAALEGYKDMGISLQVVKEFTAEEQKFIDDAKTTIQKAEGQLVRAQAIGWNIFGRRDRAIAEANTAISTAKTAETLARQQAEAMRRERLNNMNLEQSLQLMQGIAQEFVNTAQGNIADIEAKLALIGQNLVDTMDEIKVNTAKLEERETALAQANAELTHLNAEFGTYVENSSEWQNCRSQILEKERERNQIETERNTALTLAQEGQKFLEMNRVQQQGATQQLGQHKIWIQLLQMGTDQRSKIIEAHLSLIKHAADQEAMAMIDGVATETDERLTMDAATTTQAMRQGMMKRIQSFPAQIQRMRSITAAEVENQAKFEKDFAEAIEKFRHDFGTEAGYDNRDTHRATAPAA